MAARWFDEGDRQTGAHRDGFPDQERPGELERYRAWIAAKLFQGLAILVLMMVSVVLFDSW
jgi:hypothetical protein